MYLDVERLLVIDPVAFQTQEPFPWINPARLLTEEGYHRLLETLPNVALFKKKFGGKRNYGQQPHALEGAHTRSKVDCLHRSRFARTLYLDADIRVIHDISEMFIVLDRFDIALAHDPELRSCKGDL